MPTRSADAVWEGGLKDGKGTMKLQSGVCTTSYSFATRFENAQGTNPEELIGAAHAGCFSMALSAALGKAGYKPEKIATNAKVTVEQVPDGFKITRIELTTTAKIPGIDNAAFQQQAEAAKKGCPVSKALAGTDIHLKATLE